MLSVRLIAVVLLLSVLPQFLYWATHAHLSAPIDGWFPGIFVDFRNIWLGGKLWREGDFITLTDKTEYNLYRQLQFPLDVGHIWSYPLHFLFFVAPLSYLQFLPAAFLWLGSTYAVLIFSLVRMGFGSSAVLFLVLLSSGNFYNLFNGQNSALFGPLLWGAMLLPAKHPVLAGLCLGLLSMKPQLLLFAGIFLLLTRSFRTIAVGIATASLAVAATTLRIGIEPWALLFSENGPEQTAAMFDVWTLQPYAMTWYSVGYRFSQQHWPGVALQILPTAAALLLCVIVSLSRKDRREKADAVLVLMALGLPYLLVYDLMLLLPVVLRVILDRANYARGHRAAAVFVTFGGILGILLMITRIFPLLQVSVLILAIYQMRRFFALPDAADDREARENPPHPDAVRERAT